MREEATTISKATKLTIEKNFYEQLLNRDANDKLTNNEAFN
jgi:hypothetical protein